MTVTPDTVRAVIAQYVKAWSTNDKALLLSIFADNAQWCDPVGTPPFEGRDGVAKFWDFAHQDTARSLTPKVDKIIANGNEGILRFTMQVRSPSTNQGLDLAVVDRFVLDGAGKIVLAQAYWDEGCVSIPDGMQPLLPDVESAQR